MQGFQQHQGYPQPGYPQVGAAGQGYTQIAAAPAQQGPYVSERGAAALLFIYQLDALASTGLVHKPRQKYVLTDMGKAWVEQSTGAQ